MRSGPSLYLSRQFHNIDVGLLLAKESAIADQADNA